LNNKDLTYAIGLWKYEDRLTLEQMKDISGITIPTLRSYLNGSFSYIKPKSMAALLPCIEKYIPRESEDKAVIDNDSYNESLEKNNYELRKRVEKLEAFILRMAIL
jgi:hypothetical protein